MPKEVDIHIERVTPQSAIVIVRIRGPLDTMASYAFHEKMKTLIAQKMYKFIIDLAELEYISSAGIGVFPGIALELEKNQGGIVFINISPKIYKLFDMIGLTTIFSIKDTMEEAVEEFEPDEQ